MLPTTPSRLASILAVVALLAGPATAGAGDSPRFALGTEFTYQGRLQHDARPADGVFDLSFELYDTPLEGRSFGRIDLFDVPVRGGAFTVELDYGRSVFAGEPLWLAIEVRREGEAGYATLEPRQRVSAQASASCTVDNDVLINGTLDVDPIGAEVGIEVACCNNADLASGGMLVLGGFLSELAFDSDAIQSRSFGTGYRLLLNPFGGNVGVGVANAEAPFHLPGAPDAGVSSGGVLTLGSPAGVNLTMDRNEIMARNNGAASILYVNLEGGTVKFGGPIDIGYEIVTANGCGSSGSKTVSCPTGKAVLGGGCFSDRAEEELERSSPSGTTGWTCRWEECGSGAFGSWTTYAICANVKP